MTADEPPSPASDPVLRDDQLLDALVRGEPPPPDQPADDPVAALLADWHTELVARSEQVESRMEQNPSGEGTSGPAAPPSAPPARPAPVLRRRPAATTGDAARGRPRGRRRTALAGAALTLVTVVGGLWLGAARAEPGGLFWPVTELVYADRAESLTTQREVGRMLDEARQDLADHRYADARRHLEQAAYLLRTAGDDRQTTRLRADLDQLHRLLPEPTTPVPPTGTSAGPPTAVTGPPAGATDPSELEPDTGASMNGTGPAEPPPPASSPHPAPAVPLAPARPAAPARPTTPAPAAPAAVTRPAEPARGPGSRRPAPDAPGERPHSPRPDSPGTADRRPVPARTGTPGADSPTAGTGHGAGSDRTAPPHAHRTGPAGTAERATPAPAS